MNIRAVEIRGSRAVFQVPSGTLFVEVCGVGSVRVSIAADSLLPARTLSDAPSWHCSEDDRSFNLAAGNLRFSLQKDNGRMTWYDAGGGLLLSQPFPELSRRPVIKYRTGAGEVRTVKTVDGERSFADDLVPYEDRTAFRARVFFDFQQDERLHGLGQAEEGIYDYRGKTQYLYQHNMRIPIPFLLSDKGYGVYFDCGCLMTFNDSGFGSYIFLDTVDTLDFYFLHDTNTDGIIGGMRKLTGAAALLPKWAFGYIQSREAYHNQHEPESIMAALQRRTPGKPLAVIAETVKGYGSAGTVPRLVSDDDIRHCVPVPRFRIPLRFPR
ncbi:hypothetical protein FACS1894147_12100 [Spirochaetia bacterium]|nr:hypothetical protein FACS1894147_12100 [Spirochaetia bacterium]